MISFPTPSLEYPSISLLAIFALLDALWTSILSTIHPISARLRQLSSRFGLLLPVCLPFDGPFLDVPLSTPYERVIFRFDSQFPCFLREGQSMSYGVLCRVPLIHETTVTCGTLFLLVPIKDKHRGAMGPLLAGFFLLRAWLAGWRLRRL